MFGSSQPVRIPFRVDRDSRGRRSEHTAHRHADRSARVPGCVNSWFPIEQPQRACPLPRESGETKLMKTWFSTSPCVDHHHDQQALTKPSTHRAFRFPTHRRRSKLAPASTANSRRRISIHASRCALPQAVKADADHQHRDRVNR